MGFPNGFPWIFPSFSDKFYMVFHGFSHWFSMDFPMTSATWKCYIFAQRLQNLHVKVRQLHLDIAPMERDGDEKTFGNQEMDG